MYYTNARAWEGDSRCAAAQAQSLEGILAESDSETGHESF
jgi:hypothetical protein